MRNVNFGRVLIGVSLGLLLIGIVALARAVEPGWYSPLDGSGQGIIIRCNANDECAVNWLTYVSEPLERASPAARELITVVNESTASTPEELELVSQISDIYVPQQVWLLSLMNCDRGADCVTELARTNGQWFGSMITFDPPEVFVELSLTPEGLVVDFEALALRPDVCSGASGGLILNKCFGTAEFKLLAQ